MLHVSAMEAYRLLSQDPDALLQERGDGAASKFESAVSEYERKLSGSHMSDDNKLAAVLRCLSGQLRTQATVLITETSTYQDLQSLIERWDTSQTKWSALIASTFGSFVIWRTSANDGCAIVSGPDTWRELLA